MNHNRIIITCKQESLLSSYFQMCKQFYQKETQHDYFQKN